MKKKLTVVHAATIKRNSLLILFIFLLSYSVLSQEIQPLTSEGISEDLGKNEELSFYLYESSCIRIGNPKTDCIEKHKFKGVNIDSSSINITIDKISSITIPVSQTRKADIDKDNVFDLSITVNGIRSQVVSVTFKSLDTQVTEFKSTTTSTPITETQPQQQTETETNTETTSDQATEAETQEETTEPKEAPKTDLLSLVQKNIPIIIGIAAVLILIIIISLIIFRKKNKNPQNPW